MVLISTQLGLIKPLSGLWCFLVLKGPFYLCFMLQFFQQDRTKTWLVWAVKTYANLRFPRKLLLFQRHLYTFAWQWGLSKLANFLNLPMMFILKTTIVVFEYWKCCHRMTLYWKSKSRNKWTRKLSIHKEELPARVSLNLFLRIAIPDENVLNGMLGFPGLHYSIWCLIF